MSNEPKGWHSRGYLPHFDDPEVTQALAFRLADSLPREAIERVRDDPVARTRLEAVLDRGIGGCWLRKPAIALLVETALLHFDNQRYRLLAWCVMPNHVHVVIEIGHGERLGDIVGSWKRFTARKVNTLFVRSGSFWQKDYWDRYIRNEAHLAAAISYAEQNPVTAGLACEARDWPWSSARMRIEPA